MMPTFVLRSHNRICMFIEVSAAILIRDNRVLITRRARGQNQAGYWEFPGGKLEPNETPQQCLERELEEELGIHVKAGVIVARNTHEYDDRTVEIIALHTQWVSGTVSLSVHDAYEWVRIPDLLTFRLAPADIAIARTLMDGIHD